MDVSTTDFAAVAFAPERVQHSPSICLRMRVASGGSVCIAPAAPGGVQQLVPEAAQHHVGPLRQEERITITPFALCYC